MLIAILVFVMFAGGTVALAKQTNGRSRGRSGASRSRASRSGASRSGASRSGGSTRSGGPSGRGAGRSGGSARSGSHRGSYQSGRRPSRSGTWFLKAWNSSGAPKTSESTLSGASAVVTGKAAGALSRGGWWVTKRTGRAGKWFAGRAMIPFDRWLERKHAALTSAAAAAPDSARDAESQPTNAPSPDDGLSWRERYDREQKYKRFVELRRAGSPLTLAQFNNEVEPHPNQAELLYRLFNERFDREHGDAYDISHDVGFDAAGKRKLLEFKLRTKEQWLKDTVAAFEKYQAESPGDLTPEDVAEHMKTRRRYEADIAELRQALNLTSTPAPSAGPTHVNPFRSNKGEPVAETMPTSFDRASVPNTLAVHLNHVAEMAPENDADLLNFLKDEVTGMLAYAEAINTMFEHCVTEQGLDPAAMQGVSDYAEAFTENAEAAANGHKQFMAVYEAIIEAANNGTQMPYNGRFFSGEAA